MESISFDMLLGGGDLAGEDIKACCASIYESEPVGWLLDGQLHPGGEALTRRTAQLAGIGAGDRVLDVASGRGNTARLLAREVGANVVGLELGAGAVAGARAATAEAGLSGAIEFVEGDAESLPFAAGEFEAIVCECSLCTFPDKVAAANELARVLSGGGRVAIADVTVEPERLPAALRVA
ncbi:MAG: class I SAM-dependent methyltransferase, partial [Thermoleophilaceae bacterium]